MLDLKKRGKTVFLCSHLLADVEDICDRIAILYGGKLIAQGRVDELLARTDVTQISAENLKPETLNRVVEIISKETADNALKVDNPSQRLEEFFLGVVRAARDKRLGTSGVEAGRAASEVAISSKERRVREKRDAMLSRLMKKKKEQKAGVIEEAVPVPRKEDRKENVLHELAFTEDPKKVEKEKETAKQKALEDKQEKQRREARKSVLDKLAGDDKKKTGGTDA